MADTTKPKQLPGLQFPSVNGKADQSVIDALRIAYDNITFLRSFVTSVFANVTTPDAARQALNAAKSSGVKGHTIVIPNPGGTPGSITWNDDGVVTDWLDPK